MFDDFWTLYPRKEAKGAARKSYEKAVKNVSHETIMAGLAKYLERIDSKQIERKFIKMPATWLNQECWDDEHHVSLRQRLNDIPGDAQNAEVIAKKEYETLLKGIMERWRDKGYRHWWHVEARMTQAWQLACLRARSQCGENVGPELDDAEKQYGLNSLPDKLRRLADMKEKAFGDPSASPLPKPRTTVKPNYVPRNMARENQVPPPESCTATEPHQVADSGVHTSEV